MSDTQTRNTYYLEQESAQLVEADMAKGSMGSVCIHISDNNDNNNPRGDDTVYRLDPEPITSTTASIPGIANS